MAQASESGQDVTQSELVAEHRHAWNSFLKTAKWFALSVLGLVFFLIFWRIGGAPFLPTFVLVAIAVWILGSIFH